MKDDVDGCHGATRSYNSTDSTQENTEANWKCKIMQIIFQKSFAHLTCLNAIYFQFWRVLETVFYISKSPTDNETSI